MNLAYIVFYSLAAATVLLLTTYILSAKNKVEEDSKDLLRISCGVSLTVLSFVAAFVNTGFELPILFMILAIVFLLTYEFLSKMRFEKYRQVLESSVLTTSFTCLYVGVLCITGFNYIPIIIASLTPSIMLLAFYFFKIKMTKKDMGLLGLHSLAGGLFLGQAMFMLSVIPFAFANLLLALSATLVAVYIVLSIIFSRSKKDYLEIPSYVVLFLIQLSIITAIFLI